MEKIKIELKTSIANLCGNDKRYVVDHIQVIPKKDGGVFVTATDGSYLGVVECAGFVNELMFIPPEAFPKYKPSWRKPFVIEKRDDCWINSESVVASFAATDLRYPKLRDVIPKETDGCIFVTLDARRLLELASALGSVDGRVSLLLKPKENGVVGDPIIVLPVDAVDEGFGFLGALGAVSVKPGLGVFMPCKGNEELADIYKERAGRFVAACEESKDK